MPVSGEAAFIAALRAIATSDAARGLADDAAVLPIGGSRLVLTMDTIVEGIHFLPDDPAETVAWKLVATNVSDLAAKGARPRGCLLSYALSNDAAWNARFLTGLEKACGSFAIPLLGGDTVGHVSGSTRSFALVALGEPVEGVSVPSRSGANPGDTIWVSGTIGDAGLGLALLQERLQADEASQAALISAYREPRPSVTLGLSIAPLVSAMMDISDGLLIDTQRLAKASGRSAIIELDKVPLSPALLQTVGDDLESRISAASAGDDYCLLFTAPQAHEALLMAAAKEQDAVLYKVGAIGSGEGLTLLHNGAPVPLPDHLGFQH